MIFQSLIKALTISDCVFRLALTTSGVASLWCPSLATEFSWSAYAPGSARICLRSGFGSSAVTNSEAAQEFEACKRSADDPQDPSAAR